MRIDGKGNTRIQEGVVILYSRAINHPGRVIPVIARTDQEADYYYSQFAKWIPRGRIKGANKERRTLILTNGSSFIFSVDAQKNIA